MRAAVPVALLLAVLPLGANAQRQFDQEEIGRLLDSRDRELAAPKPYWRTVEAENGAIYKLDLASIKPTGDGGAIASFYKDEGGVTDRELNFKTFIFDCQGHFLDTSLGASPQPSYAPPRSIAGEIGKLACGQAAYLLTLPQKSR